MIVGAKKAASGLIATALAVPFVNVAAEVVFAGLFAYMPPWMVQAVAWLVLIVVYVALFAGLMSLIFGQRVWDEAKGHLLADAIKSLVRLAVSWPMLVLWLCFAAYLWLHNL